jgi:hypothetical protein
MPCPHCQHRPRRARALERTYSIAGEYSLDVAWERPGAVNVRRCKIEALRGAEMADQAGDR